MVFHRSRIKIDTHAVKTMDNVCLQRTDSFKYLGAIINHKLNWTQNIDYVKNKISKGIGIMYRTRNCLTKKSLLNLYYFYIYPYLIFCIEIWGISPQTHLNPLLLMHKKIIRIMTFTSYHAHTAPIFRDLEKLTIDKLIVHRIGVVMYKFNNGFLPEVFFLHTWAFSFVYCYYFFIFFHHFLVLVFSLLIYIVYYYICALFKILLHTCICNALASLR